MITLRPSQQLMAAQVKAAIDSNATLLVQGSTGIGKTLAYLDPALKSGRRTVVSVPTRQLQKQVALEVERLGGSAVLRLGMANFFSASRINRILAGLLSEPSKPNDLIAQLRLALSWDRTIEEFVDEYSELLIDRSLICLQAGCPKSDREAYDAQKVAAEDAPCVVQTHALTLLELRFGRHHADITIFDEAHCIPSLAASAVEARLSLAEVGLEYLAGLLGNQPMLLLTDEIRNEIRQAKDQLEDPELKEQLSRLVAPIKSLKQGAAIVAKPVPSLQRISIDPARFVGTALKGTPAIFVSATLDPLEQFKASLGVQDVRAGNIQVEKFGSMTITLADRKVPSPFKAGEPDDAFFDYAAAMIRATKGNTLVLAASYDDVERIAVRVPDLIKHVRGEPLGRFVDQFKSSGGKLITPSAWEGLDLPHFIDDVVIVRLPLAPRSELRQTILENVLTARGYDTSAAQHILQAQARAESHRRLSQGIGRGIRAPDDKCRLWIADPRFPLPASMVRDARRLLSQGAAIAFGDFTSTIPERFRVGLRSPYNSCTIFSATEAGISTRV